MANRPLIVASILVLALSVLSLARAPDPRAPDRPRIAFLWEYVSLGRERFPPLPRAPDAANDANSWLVINNHGLEIIRKSEDLRLEAYYLAGQWLIGYGHAATAGKGMKITKEEADALLIADVKEAERAVREFITVPLNENEFSALVSLAYNMGTAAFARTHVVQHLNNGDRKAAADAFRHIVAARINGERVVLDALKRRRVAERALFLAPTLRA